MDSDLIYSSDSETGLVVGVVTADSSCCSVLSFVGVDIGCAVGVVDDDSAAAISAADFNLSLAIGCGGVVDVDDVVVVVVAPSNVKWVHSNNPMRLWAEMIGPYLTFDGNNEK